MTSGTACFRREGILGLFYLSELAVPVLLHVGLVSVGSTKVVNKKGREKL